MESPECQSTHTFPILFRDPSPQIMGQTPGKLGVFCLWLETPLNQPNAKNFQRGIRKRPGQGIGNQSRVTTASTFAQVEEVVDLGASRRTARVGWCLRDVAVVVKAVLGSHFGVGAPPLLVCFSGHWDVHWGFGILTHDHLSQRGTPRILVLPYISILSRNPSF